MEQEALNRKRIVPELVLYAIGFLILAYFTIIVSDDLTQGILVLLCYVPLFLFARYLRQHGGMGWQWPA